MKKVIALFIMALIPFSLCLGETLNLRDFSDSDLLALHDSVKLEMATRFSDQYVALYPGIYVIGEGIESGSYTFLTGIDLEDLDFYSIKIYSSEEQYEEDNYVDLFQFDSEAQFHYVLNDGMILNIEFSSFIAIKD